jgi:transglutaminase-like putative cysteine protease
VLFIALYQPVDGMRKPNEGQRLLITALIFTASIATSTDITIVIFVVAFAFMMFREMMFMSHAETARSVEREYADAPSSRAAAFYLTGTTVLATLLFPIIPRVRNPLVHGIAGTLTNATSGLSSTIDFNHERTSSPDPTVVARIWMGPEAVPFFTPVRLRGAVYDRFHNNQWLQSRGGAKEILERDGAFPIGFPAGFRRSATVEQRFIRANRLYIPTGTYAISGLPVLFSGPFREELSTLQSSPAGGDAVTFTVSLAHAVSPLRPEFPPIVDYPATPEVTALAARITGNESDASGKAAAIEQFLLNNYRYVIRPEAIGHPMSVDDFLLREKRGHCEYFAAGMVALLSVEHVPARIVGGYYGGRLNPLTGYFLVRREDAHAWVEVWDGSKWTTYDPTPPTMRPGNTQSGLLSTYATAISDSVNYFWDRYVLTFGLADQVALAADLISRTRATLDSLKNRRWHMPSISIVPAVAAILFAILLVTTIARRRRSLFDILAEHLARLGIEVGPAMTMEEALVRLKRDHAAEAHDLEPLIAMYEAERFSSQHDARRVAAIRKRLAELRG